MVFYENYYIHIAVELTFWILNERFYSTDTLAIYMRRKYTFLGNIIDMEEVLRGFADVLEYALFIVFR